MSLPTWALNTEQANKRKVLKSAAITISSGGVRFVGSLMTALILGRLLTPDDFGVIAMVAPLMAFTMAFSDSGIANYTLQVKQVNENDLNHTFWLGAIVASTLYVIFSLLSPFIVAFYGEERLGNLSLVLATSLLLTIFTAQHNALAKRCFRQDYYAIAEIAGSLAGLACGVGLALLDYGYWALASIPIARQLTHAFVIWLLTGWHPNLVRLNFTKCKTILTFGMYMISAQAIGIFAKNIDKVLIGWKFGTEEVGFYGMAYSIMMLPFLQVMSPVGGAIVPYLSQVHHANSSIEDALNNILMGLGLIIIPLMLWAAFISNHLLILCLGNQWAPAADIFSMLALTSISMALGTLAGWTLVATGQPKALAKWTFMSSISLVVSCLVGLSWGGLGVATALCINSSVMLIIFIFYLSKFVPIRPITFLMASFKIILSGLLSIMVIYTTQRFMAIPIDKHFIHIITSFLILALTFPLFVYCCFPYRARTLAKLLINKRLNKKD